MKFEFFKCLLGCWGWFWTLVTPFVIMGYGMEVPIIFFFNWVIALFGGLAIAITIYLQSAKFAEFKNSFMLDDADTKS